MQPSVWEIGLVPRSENAGISLIKESARRRFLQSLPPGLFNSLTSNNQRGISLFTTPSESLVEDVFWSLM